jgi:hypothetical protein
MNSSKSDVFRLSLAASLVSALIILSFRQYFFYLPFQNGFNLLSILGFLALLGWISLVIVPPILLLETENWTLRRHVLFLISVSVWTLSTLAIKIYNLLTFGQIWADYLILYPALFFVEWLLPAYYIYLSLSLRNAFVKESKVEVQATPRFDSLKF